MIPLYLRKKDNVTDVYTEGAVFIPLPETFVVKKTGVYIVRIDITKETVFIEPTCYPTNNAAMAELQRRGAKMNTAQWAVIVFSSVIAGGVLFLLRGRKS